MSHTPTERITGRIIKVHKGGYGFITSKDKPFTRIFFHWTSLKNETLRFPDLRRGMEVEFELIERDEKGWIAIKIEVIDPIPETGVEYSGSEKE